MEKQPHSRRCFVFGIDARNPQPQINGRVRPQITACRRRPRTARPSNTSVPSQ